IVLPGIVAALEGVRGCGRAQFVRGAWYEFLPTWNPREAQCGWLTAFVPFDTVPTFDTIHGTKILRIYPGAPSDIGKKLTFFGQDKNGLWVRSVIDGVYQDGEQVTLADPFVDTVTEWSTIAGVQKDVTDEQVLVYAHDSASTTLTPIAAYQYWETK